VHGRKIINGGDSVMGGRRGWACKGVKLTMKAAVLLALFSHDQRLLINSHASPRVRIKLMTRLMLFIST